MAAFETSSHASHSASRCADAERALGKIELPCPSRSGGSSASTSFRTASEVASGSPPPFHSSQTRQKLLPKLRVWLGKRSRRQLRFRSLTDKQRTAHKAHLSSTSMGNMRSTRNSRAATPAFFAQPRSSGCFGAPNWRCRYDHLDKPRRDVINEAGDEPLIRQCRNHPERSNVDSH
jgi:hypothetical protein